MSGLWFKEAGVGGGVKEEVKLEAVRDDKGEEMGTRQCAHGSFTLVCMCEHQYKEDDKKR
jgi:hypothetical protein